MSDDLLVILVLSGLGGLCYCLFILFGGDSAEAAQARDPWFEEMARELVILAELKKATNEWKYQQRLIEMELEEAEKSRTYDFDHPEISRFFEVRVRNKPFFNGPVLEATIALLQFLDKHGDCPSVVDRHCDEPEKKFKERSNNVYAELARIPLYLHSIHTAEEAFNSVKLPLASKLAIAALAHDLGKIPDVYGRYYVSGTHAFASAAFLESFDSVRALQYFKDLQIAIRNHHVQSNDYFDRLVRECDQAARRKEINRMAFAALQTKDKLSHQQGVHSASVDSNEPPSLRTIELQLTDSGIADQIAQCTYEDKKPAANAAGDQHERQRAARKLIDVSQWLDPGRLLGELSKIVNTRQGNELFWSALSLGPYVYFKPAAFWSVIEGHSRGNCVVLAAVASEQDRDDIIYSVVRQLARLDNIIAAEFIGNERYGATFSHNPHETEDGKETTRLFLIPFLATAFVTRGTFEKRKTAVMSRTTQLLPCFRPSSDMQSELAGSSDMPRHVQAGLEMAEGQL